MKTNRSSQPDRSGSSIKSARSSRNTDWPSSNDRFAPSRPARIALATARRASQWRPRSPWAAVHLGFGIGFDLHLDPRDPSRSLTRGGAGRDLRSTTEGFGRRSGRPATGSRCRCNVGRAFPRSDWVRSLPPVSRKAPEFRRSDENCNDPDQTRRRFCNDWSGI